MLPNLSSGERRCTPVSVVRFLSWECSASASRSSILHYGVAGAAFERAWPERVPAYRICQETDSLRRVGAGDHAREVTR